MACPCQEPYAVNKVLVGRRVGTFYYLRTMKVVSHKKTVSN